MRIGANPEKAKASRLNHKTHRVIVPFWIPNVSDDYFKHQPEVLRKCLTSLVDTIDQTQTNITLINNHSCHEATVIAEEFVAKGVIDKYVVRSENRGKLEIVLAEARAAFEDYITISDADFLFFPGWEAEVSKVFRNFPKAGVVTCYPCPNLALNHNLQWVLRSSWKTGAIVPQSQMDLVDRGLGHQSGNGIYNAPGIRKRHTWAQKQFYLQNNGHQVCLGAVHALATTKRDIIAQLPFRKIEYVFKNGYEQEHLDYFSDWLGYFRVSTTHCFAYHMGNTLPDGLEIPLHGNTESVDFPKYSKRCYPWNKAMYLLINPLVRILRKWRWL